MMYVSWDMVHDGQTDGQTDGWMDGQKKWYIEVVAPPKNCNKINKSVKNVVS